MAHGYPDYGIATPTKTIYPILDIGELAARLGSVNTFDRRGNVLFLEDFQGSLAKVYTGATGTDSGVSISSQRARYGSFSCKLTTGKVTDQIAFVEAHLPYPILSKVGFEITWCPQLWLRDFDLLITLYDGASYWDFYVLWHAADDTWYYQDDTGHPVALSPVCLYARDIYMFNHTKLVIDLETKKYVRLVSNNLTWDLAGKGAWTDVSSTAPALIGSAKIYTRDNYNCTVYLGSMIVTQNEP